MKVLVIGKGGREHALVWRLNQSQTVWKIFCAGGNPGINQIAEPVPIAPTDLAALADFALSTIDRSDRGRTRRSARGRNRRRVHARGSYDFRAVAAAAQLETSKAFAKT